MLHPMGFILENMSALPHPPVPSGVSAIRCCEADECECTQSTSFVFRLLKTYTKDVRRFPRGPSLFKHAFIMVPTV